MRILKKTIIVMFMTVMTVCLAGQVTSAKSASKVTKINTLTENRRAAASRKNWQSVYADETDKDSYVYFVRYGKLSIARNAKNIYVKRADGTETKQKIAPGYIAYGGVLTNGEDIIYQYKKKVYLWDKVKTRKKIFTFKKKMDVLVARYGNDLYFGRYVDYDCLQVYKYNFKTKKTVKTKYFNAYYSNGKYLITGGQFHEGISAPVRLYNMGNKKESIIMKHGAFGNAAIINGGWIYVLEYNDRSCKHKIIKYNLRTKAKKVLKTGLTTKVQWLDKNHYCYMDDDSDILYVCDIKSGEKKKIMP